MKTKRKNFVFFILMMVLFVMNDLSAQTLTRTFTFNFMPEDFELSGKDEIEILPGMRFYEEEINFYYGELRTPALLYFEYPVLIPDNYKMKDFTYTLVDEININRVVNGDDTLEMDNIILAPTPIDISGPGPHPESPDYPLISYPAEVIHLGKIRTDGFKPESFMINPFTYHAAEGKLNLTTSITLTITIEPDSNYQIPDGRDDDAIEFIKWYVCNPEDVEKGIENWTPTSMDIAEEGKEWTIHSQVVYPYAPMITHKMRIEGDTIVNGETRKRLHCKTINEYGEERDVYEYCHQEGEIFYRNGVKMFDFGLQVGDTFHIDEYDEVLAVTEVSTIVLNDGVTRKCLSMGVWHSDSEDIPTQDKWIEGIGSLKMGIYDNSIMRTGVKDELQSVMSNDRCLYRKESKSEYPYIPVVIKGNPIPENPSTNDNIEFSIELGIFQGNETYKQQVDSVIGNTIYTSGTYNRYWPGAALFNQTKTMILGMLEKGEYTLRHNIMALNGKALTGLDSTFVYTFTVMDANNIGSLTKQEFNVRTTASTLLCTSPDAIKLEVYTMDAVKVGEARFVDGEASVKVGKAPATYLYIVTYPDGRRESGKVVGKG